MAEFVPQPSFSDPPTPTAPNTPPAAKGKIQLRFNKPHNHNGKTYAAGETETFSQADADAIRSAGTADTVMNPSLK